jgi:hypothetical protein
MGLPFQSGHVLGLRRWTASSVGEGFTSIWHRNPERQWTFYESAPCARYFGAAVERVRLGAIRLECTSSTEAFSPRPSLDHTEPVAGVVSNEHLSSKPSLACESLTHACVAAAGVPATLTEASGCVE